MPVEIRELIIKTSITQGGNDQSQSENSGPDKEEIIQSCVEQVLKIIERKNER